MRVAFTLLALLLVALLSIALAAPYFIDWTAQRKQIEAQLSRVLGARVEVAGPIDLKLLPVPFLTLAKVHVAETSGGAATLDSDNIRLEMALAALIRGQFRFTQASFNHPVLTIVRDPAGGFVPLRFGAKARSDQVALEKVLVRDGRISAASAAGAPAFNIAGIDLDAEADSLRGPFKGAGAANGPGGGRVSFHFASGILGDGALPAKGSFEAADASLRGEFDGVASFAPVGADAKALALSYSGAAHLAGSAAFDDEASRAPWSFSGTAEADERGAQLSNLEVRFGEEQRALIATGSANATFREKPALSINLASKKLDLDAMLRRQDEGSAAPARALDLARRLAARAGGGKDTPFDLSFDLASPSAILGGDTISDISLHTQVGPHSPIIARLECGPPGRSHLIASGIVELGAAEGFKGRVDAQIGDAQALRDWSTQDAEPLRASLAALGDVLPYRSLAFGGDVDLSNAGFAVRNLRLAAEQSVFEGTLAWTGAMGNERSRLFMDLRSDALDLASLPNLGAGGDYFRDSDLELRLEAKALRVERIADTSVSGGQLAVKVTKSGDAMNVDRLAIKGLGGADVEAKGGADASGSWIGGRVEAAQLHDFAALARRLAPGAASDFLVDRSSALSPASLTFKAQFSFDSARAMTPNSLTLSGSAGATQIEARIGRGAADPGALEASFTLNAPETAPLLRQLGAPAQSLSGKGRGQFSLTARGRAAEGFDAEAAASLSGVDFVWRGRVNPGGGDDVRPLLSGAGGLKGANVAPLLQVLGVSAADSALVLPASLDADLVWRDRTLSVARLRGSLGSTKLEGGLTWAPPAVEAAPTILDPDIALAQAIAGESAVSRSAQIEGQLTLDRLGSKDLAGLALGAAPAKPGVAWSSAPFAPPLARTPPADMKIAIRKLDLSDAVQAQDASARVRIDPGSIKFTDVSMNLRDGRLTGHGDLRRNGANAAISGQIGFDNLPFATPAIAGRASGTLDIAGGGQSPNALIGDLAGQGQIQIVGAKAAHLDPGALRRIVDKTQSPDYPIDQTNIEHALGVELDRQPLALPDASLAATLSGGVLKIGPIDVPQTDGRASLSASVDLKALTGQLRATFSQMQTTKYWSGAPPAISVDIKGAFDAPTRSVDSAAFAAGLAQQAIARESDRIAALEADMRERAAFNRRLKADQFMLKREQELAAFKSAQDRKRVEEETLKAAEDARKAEEARKAEQAAKAAETARKDAEEAARVAEAVRAAEAAKAADEAAKAAEMAAKAAGIAPPLPDEAPPPVFNMLPPPDFAAPAPMPPPKPRAPARAPADPTAGGLY